MVEKKTWTTFKEIQAKVQGLGAPAFWGVSFKEDSTVKRLEFAEMQNFW